MAIHNRSHHNHALMSLNKMRKDKYFFQTLHTFNKNVPHKTANTVQTHKTN